MSFVLNFVHILENIFLIYKSTNIQNIYETPKKV